MPDKVLRFSRAQAVHWSTPSLKAENEHCSLRVRRAPLSHLFLHQRGYYLSGFHHEANTWLSTGTGVPKRVFSPT